MQAGAPNGGAGAACQREGARSCRPSLPLGRFKNQNAPGISIFGAGEGNRTLVVSLEGFCSTIELHPQHLEKAACFFRSGLGQGVLQFPTRPLADCHNDLTLVNIGTETKVPRQRGGPARSHDNRQKMRLKYVLYKLV